VDNHPIVLTSMDHFSYLMEDKYLNEIKEYQAMNDMKERRDTSTSSTSMKYHQQYHALKFPNQSMSRFPTINEVTHGASLVHRSSAITSYFEIDHNSEGHQRTSSTSREFASHHSGEIFFKDGGYMLYA